MESGFRIDRITEDNWAQLRTLRLEMLADTPLAFLETLDNAAREQETEWRSSAARAAREGSVGLAAIDTSSGNWIGTMSAYLDGHGDAMLVSVYVTPAWRGTALGLTDALLDEVEAWARAAVPDGNLRLHVHEDNPRARAFYTRRGYVETGETIPYPLDRTQNEVEMVLDLS
ncbi:Acetyltransferase (GNAT) family protein [Agreia bicolorata]|uniref:Acetyltransferase (GNAT) family protein n=1 Tax=Agreia bicolorata TaxID=110935 RepID=A0A1T4Y2K4_9MICO|nr:GNAT family N-acetyltransferase [Agreia bicolorata]SKA95515.1 Acetyltransferase (GNAT) family protein [Agreia bicolorata]